MQVMTALESQRLATLLGQLESSGPIQSTFDPTSHSLAEISTMLDAALHIGISILDADLRYVFISTRAYRQFGLTSRDLKPGDHISRVHQLMQERGLLDGTVIETSRVSAEHLENQEVGQSDQRVVPLADGRHMRLSRVRLGNGYTVSISEDVTDLVHTNELLEDALELGLSGYWIYDFAESAYRYSHSLARLLTPEQLEIARTRGPIATVHPDDRTAYREALEGMTANGDRFECETRASFIDRPFWFRSTGQLHRFPDGRPHQLRCFVRNITRERRRNAELSLAKDEAVAASRAKSQFLANMSHEIRTPMNGVLGMAELLAGTAIDDRQREFVDVITRSATSLLTVINDILDFSKIEADALALDPHPFSLRDLVDEVMTLLSPNAAEKGLELVVAYPADVPSSFVGDGTRIRQVITNLVGNAIKFTAEGHVLITVAAAAIHPDKTAALTVSVADTGIGIAPEKLGSVFDKFTQADNSTTRIYGGTGLGLSIAKRLAEMMDGNLRAESVYGEGATFTFTATLPLDRTAKPVVRNTGPLRGRRVLIVDDIDVNRRVLCEQLSGWGIRATAVADGVEALLALRNAADPASPVEPFDLAILDYLMPGVNGRELAAMMQAQPGLDVPVLMLSSCDQQQVRDLDGASGVDRYLLKPVREQALFDAVLDMIYRDGPKAEDDPPTSEHDQEPAPAPPGKVEILVAEDFPLNQDVVRLMLADTRYRPVMVGNGREAADLYRSEAASGRYRAVLMDISMPVMDGYEAASHLRATEAEQDLPRIPVIALTGHALTHEREKCLEAGMDDYLTKPVKQVELIAALDRWTEHESRLAIAG